MLFVVLVGVGLGFLISGSPASADTIVGAGLSFPDGVAIDRSEDVFIADTYSDRVVVGERRSARARRYA